MLKCEDFSGVSKVSVSKKIPLLITARQQRSASLANTKKRTEISSKWQLTACRCEMKKKLDTDDEGIDGIRL